MDLWGLEGVGLAVVVEEAHAEELREAAPQDLARDARLEKGARESAHPFARQYFTAHGAARRQDDQRRLHPKRPDLSCLEPPIVRRWLPGEGKGGG